MRRDGFTLVEAMVALLVLALALVPLAASLTEGVRARAGLDAHLEAVAIAEAEMARLAILPLDSLAAHLRPRERALPAPLGAFRVRTLLRPMAEESPALLQAAVLVRWPGGTYTLETVLRRRDLLPDPAGPLR